VLPRPAAEHIGEGKDSVGTRVELDHVGATLLGMWIEITVKLVEVNGPAVTFEFSARDALEEVARGRHSRFVVGVDKTRQRLLGKLAKAQAPEGSIRALRRSYMGLLGSRRTASKPHSRLAPLLQEPSRLAL
jgi:hypothetical protein